MSQETAVAPKAPGAKAPRAKAPAAKPPAAKAPAPKAKPAARSAHGQALIDPTAAGDARRRGVEDQSALRRYGPLAALVVIAQLAIGWVLIQVLLVRPPAPREQGDPMLAQAPMGEAETPEAASAAELAAGQGLPFYYAPPPFRRVATNPGQAAGERFLVASVQLGLKAYDRTRKPPKDDITAQFEVDADATAILDKYAPRMRAIMIDVLSHRSLEELDRADLGPIQGEIRERLNREVLKPAFADTEGEMDVVAVEILFTELIIQ